MLAEHRQSPSRICWTTSVGLDLIIPDIYPMQVQTPLERANNLSDALGNNLLLKREDLQPVFSFKLRGAFNKMAKLPREALQRGVITSSAGNHAQGVALAASKLVRGQPHCMRDC